MKFLLIIGDGMADDPIPQLSGRTPLETAAIPVLDECASRGIVGSTITCPPPLPAGSETGILSIFGCDPRTYFTGRASLEAAGAGISLSPGDIAFRVNLVTLDGQGLPFSEKRILSHNAGSISGDDCLSMMNRLLSNPLFCRALDALQMDLYPFPTFRQIAVQHTSVPSDVCFFPPHDHIGEQVSSCLPKGKTGSSYCSLMALANAILENDPVNIERRKNGLLPANGIWFWAHGHRTKLPDFYDQYGKTGAVISAVPLVHGIASLRGLEAVHVPGATGELDTNYEGKADAVWQKLHEHDFVCLHYEAPDECSHCGDLRGKLEAIERLDSRLIGPVLRRLHDEKTEFRMLCLSDHKTLIQTRGHASGPVPFLLCDSRRNTGCHARYSEKNGNHGIFVEHADDLLSMLFSEHCASAAP